jgi:mannose-6-phosphate isomerase
LPVVRLHTHRVTKPWGRHDLAPLFPDQPQDAEPVGEIWFEDQSAERELLIKYLFTSERLSVQVHPDDAQAQARGYPRGKDEAWVVLAAEPHSTIALGLKHDMDPAVVRAGALDGSIEDMLYWKPVEAGEVIYSPAGTIHAIGAGLRVIEIQQNLDLTYRFYDYGSPRELHLDDAMAVSHFGPFEGGPPPRQLDAGRTILSEKVAFVLERWTMQGDFALSSGDRPIWLLPVEGAIEADGERIELGNAVIAEGETQVRIEPGSLIYVAYAGADIIADLVKVSVDAVAAA